MYPVSEAFMNAIEGNTRKYYRTYAAFDGKEPFERVKNLEATTC
ncbi:MAG: hypothetical protein RR347_08815 [Anaerovoracaceae bacterium]